MTSSLVGSEMCIRDSLIALCMADAVANQWCGVDALNPEFPSGLYAVGEPVSYTHLTLPTICSV
eukprot:10113091-Prorocentrum_lima.AAC.1